jgi:hypothetical protein
LARNLGSTNSGVLVVEGEQPVLIGGKTEEVVLLLDPLRRDPVLRTLAVDELRLGVEGLAAAAVEPRVDAFVNLARVVDPLQELLYEAFVALVGRADEESRWRR